MNKKFAMCCAMARKSAGFSQEAVAELCGVSVRSISDYETGRTPVPDDIAAKMVEGRIKKFLAEITLNGQAFVMNPDQTVAQFLKENGAEVVSFVRYKVGDGIEKKEVDYAAEVAAAAKV